MAKLLFRDSQGREGAVELSPAETVYVGRGLECAIRTDDGMVSRKHAQFRMENGRFVVEDLGSANGTHLNSTRIQKQAIGHADVIQCGSLVIRFIDEGGVNVVPQQIIPGASPPPKKGGTMVLDRGDGGGAGPMASAPAGFNLPPGQPISQGFPPPAAPSSPSPFGAPPAMPSAGTAPALPYGGPPQMPGGGTFGGSRGGFGGSAGAASAAPAAPSAPAPAAMPYGGPPQMPAGDAPANPSMFGRGGPVSTPQSSAGGAQRVDPEQKVLVDLGLQPDPGKASAELKAAKAELEKVNANYEREVADGKRIRAESATLRERIEELRAAVKDREEQAAAHDRVADQLRDEVQQQRDEHNKLRGEMGELAENMAARERQAARAQEDAVKIREDMQDLNRQLMELSRTKDEGWKKLNEQLTEIDHLREVINEQERMLEERRVGLISQEEVIKELRLDKERSYKTVAQLKAERDEAATNANRLAAQIGAIEDENKRLGRLLVESQTDQGRATAGQGDHLMKMTSDIRDVRVELKKVEADRDQLEQRYDRTERDREKLEGRLAQVEVELQEAIHAKLAADSARGVAQDALAKAEVARHRSAEEALNASKARDVASTGGDDARRELDRLRRKVADLEKLSTGSQVVIDAAEQGRQKEAAERKAADLGAKLEQAERSVKGMQLEIDAAKFDAQKARGEAARAKAAAGAHAELVTEAPAAASQALAERAKEVYEAINDILSEMRNNVVLVQGELPKLAADAETKQAVEEAIDALVDSAETAKGALRGLRDLAENR